MIKELADLILSPAVILYLIILVLVQAGVTYIRHLHKRRIAKRRKTQGLDDRVLINHSEQLAQRRSAALLESTIFIASVIVVPFILTLFFHSPDARAGLGIAFGSLFLWLLFNGTEMAKAFLGGLWFKTLVAYTQPFQVGDRVTIKGISGKVTEFGNFYIKLQTVNDDLISLPTYTLWGETLTSANAGERSSLCVMEFFLTPFVTKDQRQQAEDTIWDAIQASIYYEPAQPMQIYLSQTQDAICLTAKAYVASTYNEALFTSDVTRAFLDFASKNEIALAPGAWEAMPSNID